MQYEKSTEVFQRVHQVKVEGDDVLVKLDDTPTKIQSDNYCDHDKAGKSLSHCSDFLASAIPKFNSGSNKQY